MRRHRTAMMMLVALTTLALATTALAKPPEGKGKPDPVDGQTCEEYDDGSLIPGPGVYTATENGFTLTLTEEGMVCVDVDGVSAGTWTVDVTVGSARGVTMGLRDSVPGEWCWSGNTKTTDTFAFESPASEMNACPIGGEGGGSYSDGDPALAFTAYITTRGKEPVDVVVTVTLPTG